MCVYTFLIQAQIDCLVLTRCNSLMKQCTTNILQVVQSADSHGDYYVHVKYVQC